jgi:endonuclease YncB( thermonuclease family)
MVALAVAATSAAPADVGAQAPGRGSGSVTVTGPIRVIDGNTLEVNINNRRAGVGLIGIKAPPGNTACGKIAAENLATLLRLGLIRLDEELDQTFDAKKRRMYTLKVSEIPIAVEMARGGWAVPDGSGLDALEIGRAAIEARNAGRGCAR